MGHLHTTVGISGGQHPRASPRVKDAPRGRLLVCGGLDKRHVYHIQAGRGLQPMARGAALSE
eukprot:3323270-Pyramimonas_sp.AAC.1